MNPKKSIWLTLTITACVCSVLIVVTVAITEPYIKRNRQIKEYTAVLDVFGLSSTPDTVMEQFQKNCSASPDGQYIAYKDTSGVVLGRAYFIEGAGFWGKIKLLIAMNLDADRIMGISVLEHNETPGLGARITESDFLQNFSGKKIVPKIVIKPQADPDVECEVDAITGATETSKALERIINQHISLLTSKGELCD